MFAQGSGHVSRTSRNLHVSSPPHKVHRNSFRVDSQPIWTANVSLSLLLLMSLSHIPKSNTPSPRLSDVFPAASYIFTLSSRVRVIELLSRRVEKIFSPEQKFFFENSFTSCKISWHWTLVARGSFADIGRVFKWNMKPILVFVLGLICAVKAQNYCDRNLCNGNSHIACQHSGVRKRIFFAFIGE